MGKIDGRTLGRFGIWTFDFDYLSAAQMRASIQELEKQGWPAVWIGELFGREALTHAGFLLACTQRINIVNGIVRISERNAYSTHGASLLLADAYPGRHVLGLGFGGSGEMAGSTPLTAMSAYLDQLDSQTSPNPPPASPVRRILGAYGPKMIALARDRCAGAHTYLVSAAHTAQARKILGPDAFLGVEHAVVLEADPDKARALGRRHLRMYLRGQVHIAKLRRLGYSDEEISGVSDRLVDDLVAWGDPDTVVEKLHRQLEAGANHVAVQVVGVEPGQSMPQWRKLSEMLLTDAGAPVAN